MLVVRLELWPLGDASKAQAIGEVKIANDGTGTRELGNYRVELAHAGTHWGKPGAWKTGRVEGHDRVGPSPYHLVLKALLAALGGTFTSRARSALATPDEERLVKRLCEFGKGFSPKELAFVEDMAKHVVGRHEAMSPAQRAWAERLDEERVS